MVRRILCRFLIVYAAAFAVSDLCADERIALVIGNSRYQQVEFLPNPTNDARAVARKLISLGFDVIEYHDQTRSQMQAALRRFSEKLGPESIALFFYAGHGIQYNGRNYLIPVDADISKAYEIEYQALDLSMVLSAVDERHPVLGIVMLDACRDNPFEQKIRGVSRAVGFRGSGLAVIRNTRGTILSYATEPGSTATDGTGSHSPYTEAMLKYLDRPGLSIQEMLNEVGLEVMRLTHGVQKPWFSSSPVPRFCLAGCDPAAERQVVLEGRNRSSSSTYPKAVTSIVERIRLAIKARDMERLVRLVHLDHEQRTRLETLFAIYPQISIDPVEPSSPGENGGAGLVTFELVEAVNRGGNRVLPSPDWKMIRLRPRRSPVTSQGRTEP